MTQVTRYAGSVETGNLKSETKNGVTVYLGFGFTGM